MTIAPVSDSPVKRFAPLLLLFLGTIWGFNTSMMKMAGMEGVPPVALSTLQNFGAAIVLTLVCLLRGVPIQYDRAHLIYYFHVGLIGTAIPSVNLVNTLRELPAGVMVLAIATVPLLTYCGSLVARLERFDPIRFGGVLLGLGGVLLIVLPKASLPEAEDTTWFLIGLLTPVAYSYGTISAARHRPENGRSLALSAGMLLAMSAVLWPLCFITGQTYLPQLASPDLAAWCILAVTSIACIAYFLYLELVKAIGPVGLSVVGYIVTLTGMIFGMIFFGETHSPWVWAAAGLIFAGLALVNGRQAAGALMGAK